MMSAPTRSAISSRTHASREISENLHRAELTALQRSFSVARWIELTAKQIAKGQVAKAVQVGPHKRGQKAGGISAEARELGITETAAKRAVDIARYLTPAAQKEAGEAGPRHQPAGAGDRGVGAPIPPMRYIRTYIRWISPPQKIREAPSGRESGANAAYMVAYIRRELKGNG
jgi:hypothetical protein